MSVLSVSFVMCCWDIRQAAAARGPGQCLTNKELSNISSDYTGLHSKETLIH